MAVRAYSPVLPSVELFGAYEGIASATSINETVSLTFTPTEGNLTVVPYDGDDNIDYLQLEVGPTPSSYIPTAGSQATRAAETLTVPSANLPWPEPVYVTNTELVTNGTFDSDISGWSDTSDVGGAIAWNASGYLELDAATATSRVGQDISVTTGSVYAISVTVVDLDGSASCGLYLDFAGSAAINFIAEGVGTHTIYYVAPDSTLNLSLRNFTTGTTALLDNISVKEINPLSVSIQMDGRMTYADTGSNTEVYLLGWDADPSNRISIYIQTDGTKTGRPAFQQYESGTFDAALGADDAYSPGLNVPFNIASRHGSTFVNGAVDGTVLTENTTPVALPDLSATDLQLGYNFMGTISKFRIWADDIGDDGIAEASS